MSFSMPPLNVFRLLILVALIVFLVVACMPKLERQDATPQFAGIQAVTHALDKHTLIPMEEYRQDEFEDGLTGQAFRVEPDGEVILIALLIPGHPKAEGTEDEIQELFAVAKIANVDVEIFKAGNVYVLVEEGDARILESLKADLLDGEVTKIDSQRGASGSVESNYPIGFANIQTVTGALEKYTLSSLGEENKSRAEYGVVAQNFRAEPGGELIGISLFDYDNPLAKEMEANLLEVIRAAQAQSVNVR